MRHSLDRCLVAGVHSGCGKTSVALAMMQQARARGLQVAPFKAGPDFLDPMWHAEVCGVPSFNLDTRMMGAAHCRALFVRRAAAGDVALVEGVMGLFDGAEGVGGEGSSLDLARRLGLPVLLVVSARGMSGSLAPLVEGFARRAAALGARIAGVVANHVGSPRHAVMLAGLLEGEGLPPLLGWMEKDAPALPERHLGLVRPEEAALPDLAAALHWLHDPWAGVSPARQGAAEPPAAGGLLAGRAVAVARDAAFCFLYPANLEWLRAQGAEIRFFSPLAGESVPQADALWLPGGYPELHARALALSPALASVRAFIESGAPVLAECGGMMALGEALIVDGEAYPMAGALPCRFVMRGRLVALGYREERGGARGHEFHHAAREGGEALPPAFDLPRGDGGLRYKGLRASWTHWYFPSAPARIAGWLGARRGDADSAAVAADACGEAPHDEHSTIKQED